MELKPLDQRQSPRRSFKRQVGILVGGRYLVVHALQIGEGGMLVVTNEELKPEQLLVVTFFVPNLAEVVVRAEVRYQRGQNGYGLKFQQLPFEAKRAIRHYVAAKSEAEAQDDVIGFAQLALKAG